MATAAEVKHNVRMTDLELLSAVLGARGLRDSLRARFQSMAKACIESGQALTPGQRRLVWEVARELGVFAKGKRPGSAWEPGEPRTPGQVQEAARKAARR